MKYSKEEQIKAICWTISRIAKEQLTRATVGEENLFE